MYLIMMKSQINLLCINLIRISLSGQFRDANKIDANEWKGDEKMYRRITYNSNQTHEHANVKLDFDPY